MRHLLKTIILILIINNIANSQFLADRPIMALPSNLNGELDNSTNLRLFDPSRFNINHSFGMSLISNNGAPNSITNLNNHLAYRVSDNLQFDANIGIYMSKFPSNHIGASNEIDVAYDAGITFRPTNNSFLKLQLQKLPHYQMYQNHLQPYYRFVR